MKKILFYTIPAILVGLVIAGATNAQVVNNLFKRVGSNLLPTTASTTIGSSTVNGAFKNLNVTGTCTGCSGGSGVSTTTANTWTANQQFSGGATNASGTHLAPPAMYSVCATGCDYPGTQTGLQSAMDAASSTGGGTVLLGAGTWVFTATTTFGGSDIHVCGQGDATIIQFNGSLVPYAFGTSKDGPSGVIRYRNELCDMKIVSTAVGQGVGVLLDKMENMKVQGVHFVDVNGATYANGNQAFDNFVYDNYVEPEGTSTNGGNYGFAFYGSANQNYVEYNRTVASVTASTTGVIINGTAGVWVNNNWLPDGYIGVDVQTGSNNNSVQNNWLENNYINLQIASGVKNTTISANHLSGAGLIDIQDSGSGTFIESLVNGDNLFAFGGDNAQFEIGTTTAQAQLGAGFNIYIVGSSTREAIDIKGAGSAEVQSSMQLESNSSLRGAGTFAYDSANSKKWYWGTCYNNNDSWCLNRQTSANQTSTSAANPAGSNVSNYVTVGSAGKWSFAGPSSTIQLGITANASHGCIEMYDSVNTSTLEYIYSISGTLAATTTKPSFCQ